MAICLIEAIRNGDVNTARKILNLRKYNNIDSQTTRNDGTALFWACCRGFLDLIRLLLMHGADVNAKTAWGSTPLCAATDNNQIETARLLIQCGADLNPQTSSGDSPCHLAAYRGFAEILQILVEAGADVTLYNNKRHTPMHEAINGGHCRLAKYLQAVADLVKTHSGRNSDLATVDPDLLNFSNGNESSTALMSSSSMDSFSLYNRCGEQEVPVDLVESDPLDCNNLSLTSSNFSSNVMSFRNIP